MNLRPMSEAPTTGPVVEILALTTDNHDNRRWLVVHYAHGGGEDQPPFRGWFYWTGHRYSEIHPRLMLGWLPIELERCAECDPSFGCFADPQRCCKRTP